MSDRDYLRYDFPHAGRTPSPFWATDAGTKGILIVLGAIHLLMSLLKYIDPNAFYEVQGVLALSPRDVIDRFYIWQLVTGTLLHSGFLHLLFNGIVLIFFGRQVESRLGLKRYLVFCVAASVTASLAYVAFALARLNAIPAVGFSGACLALIVLVACWYPRQTVLFMFFIPMPLWVLAGLLVLMDLMMVMEKDSTIAHAAHLGGALYGYIYYRYSPKVSGWMRAADERAERRKRKTERKKEVEEHKLRERMDEILDKVNREGLPALSNEERKFLEKVSKRLRQ